MFESYYLTDFLDGLLSVGAGFLGAFASNLCNVLVVVRKFVYPVAQRSYESDYVVSELLFHIAIADAHIVIGIIKELHRLGFRHYLHQREEVLYGFGLHLVRHCRAAVSHGTHHLLAYRAFFLAKEDGIALAFRLAHFA